MFSSADRINQSYNTFYFYTFQKVIPKKVKKYGSNQGRSVGWGTGARAPP